MHFKQRLSYKWRKKLCIFLKLFNTRILMVVYIYYMLTERGVSTSEISDRYGTEGTNMVRKAHGIFGTEVIRYFTTTD